MKAKIIDGLITGFIDNQHTGHGDYEPQLILNNHDKAQKVLSVYQHHLIACSSFQIAIAFLSESGLQSLMATLLECEQKQIQGQVIISGYLGFTSVSALRKLHSFSNLELRLNLLSNMHVKGTLFHYDDHISLLMGSSNFTQEALSVNFEWNVLLHSTHHGDLIHAVQADFIRMWECSEIVSEDVLTDYEVRKAKVTLPSFSLEVPSVSYLQTRIQPNAMQTAALSALQQARLQGVKRSLLISATGTGKTLLAAFDVAHHQPQRLLFVAHREQLLDQAIQAFKRTQKHNVDYGKFTGSHKETHAPYLFATIQALSQPHVMEQFDPLTFDMIIIDEAHRVGGETYQTLMRYFKPNFYLGMSATPERMDGFNIYEMFDYHVAYEIRLHEALKANMLVPFHYYGVKDVIINGNYIDDKTELRYLISEDRVNHVLRTINRYEVREGKRKGLIFVSSLKEASELNTLFNYFGAVYKLKSACLSGSNTTEEKNAILKQLQSDQLGTINYVFAVDVLNEGVDIPSLNQIIMLRPTQSATIFIQQLGRGLRHYPTKDYVLVLDFIGNYANNFHIPIALASDRTFQKENLRRFVHEGTKLMHGASTINFERIVKDTIFNALDKVRFNHKSFLKVQFETFKVKYNRIPNLLDFEKAQAMDPTLFFDSKHYHSYHVFLVSENYIESTLTSQQWVIIQFLSRFMGYGKRPHEALILTLCLRGITITLETLQELAIKAGLPHFQDDVSNVPVILANAWLVGTGKDAFKGARVFIDATTPLQLCETFVQACANVEFKSIIDDLIAFALHRYRTMYYPHCDASGLALYHAYTPKEVMQIAGWKKMVLEQSLGGYYMHHETQTLPLFINYHKSESVHASIKYHDHFIAKDTLVWVSKSNRSLEDNEIKKLIHAFQNYTVMLLVRKNASDSKHYMYLGQVALTSHIKQIILPNTTHAAVEFILHLKHPLRDDIYDYIVNK